MLDRLRPRREADGTLYYDGATRDVTERRRLEDELRLARGVAEQRARTDELTGTCNRRHFAEIVAEALAADPAGCGLLLLDADHFKQVNDVHGHVVGDAVLVELVHRLQGELGRRGLPGALGRRGVRGAAAAASARTSELDARAQRLRAAVARCPVVAAGVSVRPDGVDRRHPLGRRAGDARRARRGRRPLPVLGQGPRPQPRAAVRGLARRRRRRASPRPSASPARSRSSPACGGASSTPTRPRSPSWPPRSPSSSASPTRSRCAAGSAAGCTTSARSRSRTAILAKPGPLDDAEWEVMRTHPVIGEEIVCGVDGRRASAAAAVRHHHERYDGAGYPDRLARRPRSRSRRASSPPPTRSRR